MNIRELKKEIKGIFKLPKKTYYFGGLRYGTPYYYPNEKFIISISKKKNNCRKNIKIFDYYISCGNPIKIVNLEIGWKDKFNSPRFEWNPSFIIYFFNIQFCIFYTSPDSNDDLYYEMILWFLYYSDKDIKKAKSTWGWIDYDTKKSTWNDNYLLYTLTEERKRKLNNFLSK